MALIDDLRSALGASYSIDRELGGGGMSRVFLGEETAFGRKVVVKVLAPDLVAGVSAERFQREIKLAAQLQHPNIVPVITAGVAAGVPYYTMPFVDGLSLAERLQSRATISIVEATAILRDVARALAYAHDHGVVHRDIKPGNILLADETAVVTDFGIAKALRDARTAAGDGTLTEAGSSLGTPAYMAPEQISADPSVDHRADIYAFGCVAYEMLTGAPPFAHRTAQQVYAAHITEQPASLKDRRIDCPEEIGALVMKCLEKDPGNRPQSARDLLRGIEKTSENVVPPVVTKVRPGRQMVVAAIAGIAIFSAIAAYAARGSRSSNAIGSLAVLPFENIGGDTANAYFAEGMSDEITTELTRVPGLTLASRNSVAKYRGVDPRQVGKALDVGGVIDGTVRRSGDRLRLTAQLTDAANGKVLWADTYEQKVQDVFAVQDSITKAIVSALKLKLGGAQQVASGTVTPQGTNNLEAYDLYLRGRFMLARRGQYLYQALRLFEDASKKDPNFARAYAGYAMTAALMPQYTTVRSDSVIPVGLKAARRAIALDPNLADAHLGIANLLQYDYNWKESEQHLRRAIEIEPNNASAHQWLGDLLWLRGRGTESLVEQQKSIDLDPTSAVAHADIVATLYNVGRVDEALQETHRSFELDSAFPFNTLNLALVQYLRGKYDSTIAIRTDPYPPYVSVARMMAYEKLGDQRSATLLRDSLLSAMRKPNADDDGSRRAVLFAAIGNADSTFHYIDRAIDKRGSIIYNAGLPCFFMFRFLYNDPRWDQALRRINAERCR